ncbi:hypothetical protein DL89DRAFT_264460 [Linderina pennispora]|uniref:CUE domain-containing protein n=1 Tax=Linderina pennispora TaxID=61395 RepID=A0A1Y1WMC7_9FUNG|nr:uncharacterized protein DL89DRAFT_264460 [Linderina pennispora]ORX74642.1 hypothetical protein DL89DRAFT_264460 [Linderina pennispora]
MFPDIPEAAIRLDLSRTGSPVITSDNILRNGGTLPMPPEARQPQARPVMIGETTVTLNSGTGQRRTAGSGGTSSGVQLNAAQSPLVSRLRISKDADTEPLPPQPPKVWETDAGKRAEVLMKRKEFMLMEARKKFLEKKKQSKAAEKAPAATASTTAE